MLLQGSNYDVKSLKDEIFCQTLLLPYNLQKYTFFLCKLPDFCKYNVINKIYT